MTTAAVRPGFRGRPSMLMLHISDIYFKAPECLDPSQDPDLAIRTRIMRDLTQQVSVLGEVGAILIGGDKQFNGSGKRWIRSSPDAGTGQ